MAAPLFTLKIGDGLGAHVGASQELFNGATITLTPNIKDGDLVLVDGNLRTVPKVTYTLDSNGKLNGDTGIQLLADDPSLGLDNPLQWKVTVTKARQKGFTQAVKEWSVVAGSDGDTVDLADEPPVVGVPALGTRGPRTYVEPVTPGDPDTLYQWVDEYGTPFGSPVTLDSIITEAVAAAAANAAAPAAVGEAAAAMNPIPVAGPTPGKIAISFNGTTGDEFNPLPASWEALPDKPSAIAAGEDADAARHSVEAVGQSDLWWSAKRHGVPQAGKRRRGGSMTSGNATLTFSGQTFTTGDLCVVRGAGAAGAPLVTTVSVGGTGSCTLADAAATTINNTVVDWGPDEADAINDFFAAIVAAGHIDQQISTLPGTTMHSVYPTAFFPDGGISLVGSTVTKPRGVGLAFGGNAWIRAGATIAGAVLATSVTELIQHEFWHDIGIDANQIAENNLYLPYFAGIMAPNARLGGSSKIGIIAGAPGAANSSYQLHLPNVDVRREKGDKIPAGSIGLWTQRCTDSKFDGIISGYDINSLNDSANNDFDIHAWNYTDSGMLSTVIFYDRATVARYHEGCTADAMRGVSHASASASSGTSTITDPDVLWFHAGLPVSGAGIPAGSYVGAVTPGVSFTLVNAPNGGSAVNTTGTVSGVTISGAGWVVGGTSTSIYGYALNTYAANLGSVAVAIVAATPSGDIDLNVRATPGCVIDADIVGNTGALSRVATRCSNVTTTTSPQLTQPAGKPALTLRTTAGGSTDIFRHVNSSANATLASLNTGGIWRGRSFIATRATPTYGTTVTPNMANGQWHTITVTDSVNFTIGLPNNGPGSSETAEIVVEVTNTSGGAMGTITWNSAFKFPGVSWTNPATGKSRYARFQWNGSLWLCIGLAAADY